MGYDMDGLSRRLNLLEQSVNENLITKMDGIETQINSISDKVTKLSESLEMVSDLITKYENNNTIKPISQEYIDIVLDNIEMLKNLIRNKAKGADLTFSPHYLTTIGIEKQIRNSNTVSENQLLELNNIYEMEKNIQKK